MPPSRTLLAVLLLLGLAAATHALSVPDFVAVTPTTGVQAHTVTFQNLSTTSDPFAISIWDFGDGSGSSLELHPTHTYAAPGSYSVTLTIFSVLDPGGSVTKDDYITVTPADLTADFGADVTSGPAPLDVTFTGSVGGTGNPTLWAWTFGDGTSGSGQQVQHTYVQPGSYSVTLTVHAGTPVASVQKLDLVQVGPPDLHPSFTVEPASGLAPLTVQFSDTSTGGGDTWQWDFGDGPPPWWSTQPNPQHTYAQPGVYDVSLTIGLSGTGLTTTVTVPGAVEVLDPQLEPALHIFPRGGFSPLEVTFTDTSSALAPYALELDYDDLFPAHTSTPVSTHTYEGTLYASPELTITTVPGPTNETLTLINAVQCVEPEVATFVSFGEPELAFVGVPAGHLTAADFSGDGLPDLLVEPPSSGAPDQPFSVFVQQDGAFGVPAQTFAPAVHDPTEPDVAGVADMDADGALDLVLATDAADHVAIWRGDGAGGFTLASQTTLPDPPGAGGPFVVWAAVLDADVDGHGDVVVGNRGWLTVGYGDGLGGLGALSPPGEEVFFLDDPRVVDLNQDGLADLVGLAHGDGADEEARIFHGDGTAFGPSVAYGSFDALGSAFDVGDVDGDGLLDLVVDDSTELFVGLGTGAADGFAAPVSYGLQTISAFELGDLDRDGRADLLTSYIDHRSALRLEPGGPGFSSGLPRHAATGPYARALLVDLDADGDLDVVSRYLKPPVEQKLLTVHRNLGVIGRWVDVGGEPAGSPLQLHGEGELRRNTRVRLSLGGAPPGATAFLLIGLSDVMQPFAGGVLVPAVDAVLAGAADTLGDVAWQAQWPGNVPAMTPSWYQAWVVDAGLPLGSNALLAIAAD